MSLTKSKYREKKLEEAKGMYPPGTKWTANQLELDLGIATVTMSRWLLHWETRGLLRKIPTEDKMWMRGANRYWYAFRKTPMHVMTFEEFQKVSKMEKPMDMTQRRPINVTHQEQTPRKEKKFEEARKLFPPGTKWTMNVLAVDLGVKYETMQRWIFHWGKQGWIRKIPREGNSGVKGSTRFWYAFRKEPLHVRIMSSPPTEYEKSKLEATQSLFPPNYLWTLPHLCNKVGITETTANRYMARWIAQGLVRRIETGENPWDKGSVRYRYSILPPR